MGAMKTKGLVLGLAFSALLCRTAEATPARNATEASSPKACFVIRGRAIDHRGDGFFAIWHVGTHHIFFPADNQSADLICRYFDCDSPDRQPALFADFTICPTSPYQPGAAQPAVVKRIEHPVVFTDWPPPKSPRQYVQGFYSWYARSLSRGRTNATWMEMLRRAHWDLSTELATLLRADATAQSHCNELIGIDFDPFLLTQDPARDYEVGAIRKQGDRYRVSVYRVEGGHRNKSPDVIAEVAQRSDGRWYFVNFYSPGMRSSLLTILKSPMPKCTVSRP